MSELTDLKKVRKKLKQLKEEATLESYNDIYNTCVDFDNKYHDIYLCDYINEQHFENEDFIIDYFIKEKTDSLARLRCFLNHTYEADLYKINAYENMENIDDSDMRCLCGELIDIIDDKIKELKQEAEM